MTKQAFSLIEIIITLAVVSILIGVIAATIKIPEAYKTLRDFQRVQNLSNLNKALELVSISAELSGISLTNKYNNLKPNTIYLSLPMNSATTNCKVDYPQLPDVPGYSYYCAPSSTYMNTNGSGWIPINFSDFSSAGVGIEKLPVDPINNSIYYYSFTIDNKNNFELTAVLESYKNIGPGTVSEKDGGDNAYVFEKGNNLTLTPQSFQEDRLEQPVTCVWKSYYTGYNEDGKGIFELSDGYLIFGHNWATVLPKDIIITKLNKNGEKVWIKRINGGGDEIIYSVKQLTDGNFLIVGSTNISGNRDVLVIKLDANSNIIWQKILGGSDTDEGLDFVEDSNRNIIIVGYTRSGGSGGMDGLIMKLDSNGNLITAHAIGSTNDEKFVSIDRKGSELVVAGETTSWGASWQDIFVVKLTDLTIQWANRYYASSWWDYSFVVRFDNEGNILIGGRSGRNYEEIILKLDPLGNVIYGERIFLGIGDNVAIFTMYVLPDNSFVVGGNIYGGQGWIGRIASDGSLLILKKLAALYDYSAIHDVKRSSSEPSYLITGIGRGDCTGAYGNLWFIKTDKNFNIKPYDTACVTTTPFSLTGRATTTVFVNTTTPNQIIISDIINSTSTNFTISSFDYIEATLGNTCK